MAVKGKKGKIEARERTKIRLRRKISGSSERPRLSVFRSGRHTYAQVVVDGAGTTIAAASTLDEGIKAEIESLTAAAASEKESKAPASSKSLKSALAAMAVGSLVAKRCMEKNIKTVVFDRNGFLYHGRIKAVADGARKAGLNF